jgi:hypothetical protein
MDELPLPQRMSVTGPGSLPGDLQGSITRDTSNISIFFIMNSCPCLLCIGPVVANPKFGTIVLVRTQVIVNGNFAGRKSRFRQLTVLPSSLHRLLDSIPITPIRGLFHFRPQCQSV